MRLTFLLFLTPFCAGSRSREEDSVEPDWHPVLNHHPAPRHHHRRPYYRPRFYSAEDEYPTEYRQPPRHDPYADPYSYAKHLAEWGKKFGDSDGYRGNWDSREDGQKNEEHERKAHSKESASSSHEHRHSKEDQKHQSKEEEEIHEAHKVDDADGSRKFSHFVEGKRPDGFYSKGAFGSDNFKHEATKADSNKQAQSEVKEELSGEKQVEKSSSDAGSQSYIATSDSKTDSQKAKTNEQRHESTSNKGSQVKSEQVYP